MSSAFRKSVCLFVLFAPFTLTALGATERAPQGGQAAFAVPPVEVLMSSLPERTAADLAAQPHTSRPLDGFTDAQRKERQQQLIARTTGRSNGNAAPARPNQPVPPPSITELEAAFNGNSESCCTPSDMALAVGPKYVLQATNNSLLVTNKSGGVLMNKSLQSFFGLPATEYITDPRAFYDWANGRYVVIELDETCHFCAGNRGYLLLAVSQTNNPTGAWFNYGRVIQIGAVDECPDYPTLGHDSTNWIGESSGEEGAAAPYGGIYVGINQFSSDCLGGYIQNYVFLLPKTQIYKGQGFGFWFEFGFFDPRNGVLLDTLQPNNVSQANNKPPAVYLVASDNIDFSGGQCIQGCNGLVVWAVTNPFGFNHGGPSPEFSAATTATRFNYFLATAADEPGCNNCIETLDTRISGSVQYQAGELFGALETQDPLFGTGENSPIWFELHPVLGGSNARCTGTYANACADIAAVEERNEDCFFCGGWRGHGSGYFATLQPDSENNILMTYNFSSQNAGDYPGTAWTSRRVSQADNTMNGAGFEFFGGGQYLQGRWGDYTGTAVDLTTPFTSMWFSGMYSTAAGTWNTVIGQGGYDDPREF